MIQSMTGFGTGRRESATAVVTVDVKTVNHRYLDVHVRLPGECQALEPVIRKQVSDRLRRGRVDVSVAIERSGSRVQMAADSELIASYLELVRGLQRQFPIGGEITIDTLSKVPGAITVSRAELSEDEERAFVAQVAGAVGTALDELVGMRGEEGAALVRDLTGRIGRMRERLSRVGEAAGSLVAHYRERLAARLAEIAPSVELDSSRLESESLIYADKSDISEEITRLESHMDQFEGAIGRDDEAGKRLDFLLQEMNREITTILSKTSGLSLSGVALGEAAIDIKVEIDKLREQVQNVE